jgi:DnaK suppressor protein
MSRDLAKFRKALQTHRAEVLAVRESTAADRAPQELDQTRVGRLSRMDALQAQAMSEALDQRRRIELRRIDAALGRITSEEYGFCLTCGENIQLKRLELDPAAAQCADCAR